MEQSTSNYTNQTSPSPNPVTTTTRRERESPFSVSDDNVMMKQVVDTHHHDGTDIGVDPLVNMVEEILRRASINATIDKDFTSALAHTDIAKLEAKSRQNNLVLMLNVFSHTIDKLAREMSFKCLTGGDGHSIALSLFHTVGNYDWDAKMALILAAFALNYGEFRVLAQIYSSNQLAIPLELKSRFDPLNRLIHLVLELTQCIIQFKKLPSRYVSSGEPVMKRAIRTFPSAGYWNARVIIAIATQITNFTMYGMLSSATESWEASTLVLKINHLLELLRKQLEECRRLIEERKEMEVRNSFNQLFDTVHVDNMKILKILLNSRDDPLPLFDGSTRRRVSLEVLRKKNVLLLISGIGIFRDDGCSRMDALYDLVWLPIVDPYDEYTNALHAQFEDLKHSMPWYSVYHPSNIDNAIKKSIGDRWHFRSKPILVVLDPQGRELSPNALHMMWIWGSSAFPFTIAREEALWRDETWRLELLVDGMDPTILEWVADDKFILLYATDNVDWIRKFTRNARAMATVARIPLEMAYVGKSKKTETVHRAIAIINVEKLSYCWQDITLVRYFWTRLESMLLSKIQLNRTDDQDITMKQIMKLLSYEKDGSWAMLCRGSHILTNGHGSSMMQTLADFDLWKEHIPSRGFDLSFKDYHDKLHITTHSCSRFEFPIAGGRLPERMRCSVCHRYMQVEKYIAFLCCHDQTGLIEPY
ncbi:putative sieve element occlusion [Helianthus annuus]|nr:putative sieve element occlusion [Helianthus annuus]